VAESLTGGGQLSATVARGFDGRRSFKGGVVAYQRAVKQELLEVSDGPLVSQRCASESEVPSRTKATRPERSGSPSTLLWALVRLCII
jgi:nicotinamide mononucleotide (NMN) deamidase PncC